MSQHPYAHVLAYIDAYWPTIIRHCPEDRQTLIGLPRPYLVPAPNPFDELYYWDSFFMLQGVVDTPHEHLIADVVENMAYLIDRFGMIPNASRYYFLSRSQPPFFTQLVRMAYDSKVRAGDPDADACLARWMKAAAREHDHVWLGCQHPHERLVHRGLSRYNDVNYSDFLASCESGWDHSTRCRGAAPGQEAGAWMSHLPVCLNSILFVRERDLAWAAAKLGDAPAAAEWEAAADRRRRTMNDLMYDEAQQFYFDFDYAAQARDTDSPSLAGFYPLWAGLATADQAAAIVGRWLPQFLKPGGLVTTLVRHPDRQWAAPNGWAPLQWLIAAGLDRHGFAAEAAEVRHRWCRTCADVFDRTGTMMEKYNVEHPDLDAVAGLYGNVPGFGWTNAVFKAFGGRM